MNTTISLTGSFLMRLAALVLAVALPSAAAADAPGRGRTAAFETDFLKKMIDHHYSALRITELAAGTDPRRDAPVRPGEGTSATPATLATAPKSGLDEVKSLARRNNRVQREEILTAQEFLRKWYRIAYQPKLGKEAQAMIGVLEQAPAGQRFDRAFLDMFARHHYMALNPAATCVVASDIRHAALRRYCRGILQAQLNDIEDMREMLATHFNIVDYQPQDGSGDAHGGAGGEPAH